MTSARDTLADWISDVACPLGFEHEIGKNDFSYADSILAALDAAGFAIVPKAMFKPKVNARALANLSEMAEADIAMDGDHALSVLLKHYRELTTAKGE